MIKNISLCAPNLVQQIFSVGHTVLRFSQIFRTQIGLAMRSATKEKAYVVTVTLLFHALRFAGNNPIPTPIYNLLLGTTVPATRTLWGRKCCIPQRSEVEKCFIIAAKCSGALFTSPAILDRAPGYCRRAKRHNGNSIPLEKAENTRTWSVGTQVLSLRSPVGVRTSSPLGHWRFSS